MNDKRRVYTYIDDHEQEIVEFLQRLIQIPTQSIPGENYEKITDFLAKKLDDLGCKIEVFNASDEYINRSGRAILGLEGPRSNLVASYEGKLGTPVLLLNAHTDTVPASPKEWSVDPFSGVVKEGYVYGRGACDDKAEVVAMISAVEAIVNSGIILDGDLIITATPDEEIGGIAGLGYLINEGLVKADFGLGIDGNFGQLTIAYNGRIRWRIATRGLSVHSSRAHMGINAIEKMSKIALALAEYRENTLLQRNEDIPVPPSTKMDKLTAMLNVGTIEGGLAPNIVPDYCSIIVDRRVIPKEDLSTAREEFTNVISSVSQEDPDVKAEIIEINFREGTKISPDHSWVKEVKTIYEDAINAVVPIYGTPGSADMCYQINQGKWPCVGLGCGGAYSKVHGVDENVKISELIDITKVLASVIIEKLIS